MQKKPYFVLTIKDVPTRDEEILTEMCFSAGTTGTSEVLQFCQDSLRYEPETIPKVKHDLEVFFDQAPGKALLKAISQQCPQVRLNLRKEQEKDWLEKWKKGLEPFCLASDLWVVPTWLEPPPKAKSILRIDPGMAFGTGTHATTRLAASFLSELPLVDTRVLDVGTGTGILAMAARKWGASSVVATEIDSQARVVAQENIKCNQMTAVEVSEFQVEDIKGQFDLVIANIIDGVLVEIRQQLMSHVGEGGLLLLTGILQQREVSFCKEFDWTSQGFKLRKRRTAEEWLGLLLKKEYE